MCATCGCNQPGPSRIDGQPADDIASPLVPAEPAEHAHLHVHADGTVHAHPHTHDHDHGEHHDHPHPHSHEHAEPGDVHEHEHRHADGTVHTHSHSHGHAHGPEHEHGHEHGLAAAHSHTIELNQPILAANDRQAERNRGFFKAHGLLVLNVVSSPGSGKTTLIQKTIEALHGRLRVGVVVGDLETDRDAARLRSAGATAVQITTGTLCHLDAALVARAVTRLDLKTLDVLVIENVGNLVCPAAFDLGEDLRVVLLSVTEGEDKPLKYPPIFQNAHAVVVTKGDLGAACEFAREAALANIRRAAPGAAIFEVSARTGQGLEAWIGYLEGRLGRLGSMTNDQWPMAKVQKSVGSNQ